MQVLVLHCAVQRIGNGECPQAAALTAMAIRQWGSRVQENLFKGQARNYTTSNASAPFKVTGNTGTVHENFMDAGFGGARKAAAGVSRRSLHSTSMALNALPKGAEGSWGSVHPRKLLIGGNWKSNGDVKFVNSFPGEVLNQAEFDTNLM